jgi:integrase
MPHSPRIRIGKGLYRDEQGLASVVVVGSGERRRQKERRWPIGTPLEELRGWRVSERTDLMRLAPRSVRGTLAADVDVYLDRIQHLASWRERRAELRAWTARYGTISRWRIKQGDVEKTMGVWKTDGKAPKTINNRVMTLAGLYRSLDGKKASTPCDEVELLEVHKTPPVAVSPVIVRRVERALLKHERSGQLRDGKTHARFMVLAATGRRPSEVMRTERGDVDLKRRVWTVRDGKGGSSPGIYLTKDMVAAWRAFIKAKAWGSFETSSFARVLRSAGWPKTVRPYNLRHSVGIALSESGVDLADIQAHMGHSRIATTRKFYVPVLAGRMQAASGRLEGRLGWGPPKAAGKRKSSPSAARKAG